MAPLNGENGEHINIRINDPATANAIHKAAVTRDYIKQPRLSAFESEDKTSKFLSYFLC